MFVHFALKFKESRCLKNYLRVFIKFAVRYTPVKIGYFQIVYLYEMMDWLFIERHPFLEVIILNLFIPMLHDIRTGVAILLAFVSALGFCWCNPT